MSNLSIFIVSLCFLLLILILFFDEKDYLSYSILLVMVAALVSAIEIEEARHLETYIDAIDWEVIFFLISMFTIVEILNEARIFNKMAQIIANRYKDNIRKMFYVICIVSTLIAAIIEDVSVAIIFIPIIILTCREVKINPTPFLLGMTVCINLAATLTPFGSAQNVMITNYFDLSFSFFVLNFGPFFFISTGITLFILDKTILSKELKKKNLSETKNTEIPNESNKSHKSNDSIEQSEILTDSKVIKKNLVGFGIFIVLLILIPEIHIAGIIGLIVFVILNPRPDKKGKMGPHLSQFLKKVDFKLIYFFGCLFVFVHLMELNGTILFFKSILEDLSIHNIFFISVLILFITSILSGFMDNAPVTIIFMPIIDILLKTGNYNMLPLLVAFILGINLGGNFLPQGSAADMMTLELSKQYNIQDLTYKKLTIVGGLFALLHVILGIVYLAIMIYVYPGY